MNRPSTILPKCNVSEKDEIYFRNWKKNKGIQKKFICVFSRNNSYYKKEYQGSREGTRNSKFSDLIPTIQMIRDLGYDVVRVGRDHGEVSNHKNTKDLFFDFDLFDERNKLIDLMLIKNCALFLTANSGINALAYIFQKRILYHNMFPCGMRPHFKNCTYIMKKYQNDNKLIKYTDIPKKLLLQEDNLILKEMNFELMDNSPEEIKDFVSNQLNSKFKDVIAPPKDLCVYGEHSFLDKQWFDKNQKLF
jgi:putative glycosyltransferase (TIGR04372 family)